MSAACATQRKSSNPIEGYPCLYKCKQYTTVKGSIFKRKLTSHPSAFQFVNLLREDLQKLCEKEKLPQKYAVSEWSHPSHLASFFIHTLFIQELVRYSDDPWHLVFSTHLMAKSRCKLIHILSLIHDHKWIETILWKIGYRIYLHF